MPTYTIPQIGKVLQHRIDTAPPSTTILSQAVGGGRKVDDDDTAMTSRRRRSTESTAVVVVAVGALIKEVVKYNIFKYKCQTRHTTQWTNKVFREIFLFSRMYGFSPIHQIHGAYTE